MRIDASAVRELARGRWLGILGQLAPELETALARVGRHVGCPVHGGKDGFRLFKDAAVSGGGICNSCGAFPDGFALLMWLKGWSFPETLEAVAEALGLSESGSVPPAQCWRPKREEDPKVLERLRRTWREGLSVSHPKADPLRHYLRRRGLNPTILDGTRELRFHPKLAYFEDGRIRGRFPALLALVRDAGGKAVTLHRTYLTPDGRKAPVPAPKKLMSVWGQINGGAVRLGAPRSLLSVAEGIETALAVREVTGLTVWPTLSCTLLERFEPPARVTTLLVWADRDRSGAGERAAKALEQRLSARLKVLVFTPGLPIPQGKKSLDWLDVLVEYGPMGFPFYRENLAA